jgi:hypothetical protein
MDRPFNLLDYSIAFHRPRRLTDVDCWHLHILAFVITATLKLKKTRRQMEKTASTYREKPVYSAQLPFLRI